MAAELMEGMVMKRYTGKQTVEPGLYLNLRQLAFEAKDVAGPLPGEPADVYRRVPVVVMLALAPLVGLAFVVFLPFIAFATVAWLGAVKGTELAANVARPAVRALRPGWEPALAYLSRSKPAKADKPETDAWAADAEKKLDQAEDEAS